MVLLTVFLLGCVGRVVSRLKDQSVQTRKLEVQVQVGRANLPQLLQQLAGHIPGRLDQDALEVPKLVQSRQLARSVCAAPPPLTSWALQEFPSSSHYSEATPHSAAEPQLMGRKHRVHVLTQENVCTSPLCNMRFVLKLKELLRACSTNQVRTFCAFMKASEVSTNILMSTTCEPAGGLTSERAACLLAAV